MEQLKEIQPSEINDFKDKVKNWIAIEEQISILQRKVKELKQVKKNLEPSITEFMKDNNITNLNTSNGKVKCNQVVRKKPLNKINIRENLSKIITDDIIVESAMKSIMENREKNIVYILSKPKNTKNNSYSIQ